MTTTDIVEAEVVSIGDTQLSTRIFPSDAQAMVEEVTAKAEVLANIIEDRQLYTMIRNRRHVNVSGWTTLGAMVGVFPVVVWVRPTEDHQPPVYEYKRQGSRNTREVVTNGVGGWEARVEARTPDGNVVGAAESECRYEETTWRSRDSYALKSMAQTRATSKALRMPLGFIIQLAGFDPTPEEEMPGTQHPQIPLHDAPENQDLVIWTKQVAGVRARGDADVAADWWRDAVLINDLDPDTLDSLEVKEAEAIAEVINDQADASEAYEGSGYG